MHLSYGNPNQILIFLENLLCYTCQPPHSRAPKYSIDHQTNEININITSRNRSSQFIWSFLECEAKAMLKNICYWNQIQKVRFLGCFLKLSSCDTCWKTVTFAKTLLVCWSCQKLSVWVVNQLFGLSWNMKLFSGDRERVH